MVKRKRFVLIDANALVHRAFHALPPLMSPDGVLVNAVYGFATIFLKMLKELAPDYVAASFDVAGPTFRHERYEAYKAQRAKQPQELYDQIPIIKRLLEGFGVPIYEAPGFEADDVIGTIATIAQKDVEVIIVTGDMDALQLVNDQVSVYTLKRGVSDTTVYDAAAVRERYGLDPAQMIDFKALKGDPSDNIAGVAGIGEKTATELLKKHGTLEEIYKVVDACAPEDSCPFTKSVFNKLRSGKEDAFESRALVTIRHDTPVAFSLAACARDSINREAIAALFRELGFTSLLDRIPKQNDVKKVSPLEEGGIQGGYHLIDSDATFESFFEELKKQKHICIDTETTSLDERKARLLGIAFSWNEGEAYYVVCHPEGAQSPKDLVFKRDSSSTTRNDIIGARKISALERLRPILEDPNIEKIGHNLKYDYKVLFMHGVIVAGLSFDTMIASYLLNPGSRQHNLNQLVFREIGHEMITIEQLAGEKKKSAISLELIDPLRVAEYSCEDADYTLRLMRVLFPKLKQEKLESVFHDIEMPLITVLAHMELNGITIAADFLKNISRDVAKKLRALEKNIHELAGATFNINSPKQLKEVLFERLKLETKGIGKTKTGISTAADELEKLRDAHPIIENIMEYRELAKLQSTYLEALPKLVDSETGRVYTSFNQTVTATGRLSSSDPNLQNIPVRTELGREIRKAFTADKGMILLAADYSQIELRIAAHLANDKKMIEAFVAGEDIHARTAAELHDVSLDQVTKEQRYAAKTANFGVLYGMGVGALSRLAGWSRDEARAFIEKYFMVHAGIKEYVDQTKALAAEMGYVETLFGRRRYLPEITAEHPGIRAAAERMAVNMPIQGTAADMLKKAMIAIAAGLPAVSSDTKMLLQVHDELVFEVPPTDVQHVAQFVQEEMENVVKLSVPIEVAVSTGNNWGNLQRL